ncbi:hypothetical protein JCM17380_16400 [Desulfosporosinus burensis]
MNQNRIEELIAIKSSFVELKNRIKEIDEQINSIESLIVCALSRTENYEDSTKSPEGKNIYETPTRKKLISTKLPVMESRAQKLNKKALEILRNY